MPDWKTEIRNALSGLNLEPGREEAIVEELAEHAGERYEELLGRGVTAQAAARIVLDELNGERLRRELRPVLHAAPQTAAPGAADLGSWWSGIGGDLRLAMRLLRVNPLFSLVAILSLALGVGANTAIFQIIDAVVLRTLPVKAPERLAAIDELHRGRIGMSVSRQSLFSSAIWDQMRQRQPAFSRIAAWSTEQFDLGAGGEAHYANGLWVSGEFFHVLEMSPFLGRLLAPSDDRVGCGVQGAVLSYAFWQRDFGGRSDVIGSKISLDRQPFTIIGVSAPGFAGLEVGRTFDVAIPLCSEPVLHADAPWTPSSTTWWLDAIGRLAPGWTLQRASAELASLSPGIFAATLPTKYDAAGRKDYLRFTLRAVRAATGVSPLRQAYEEPLWLLLALAGLVLLIACANLANLMLARANVRRREMALRLSLGAARARLLRQLLVESLLLAMLGAAAGTALAQMFSRLLIAEMSTADNPVVLAVPVDWRVLGFTAGLALLTCMLFGVAPALQAARAEPGAVLRTGGRGMTSGRERFLVRRWLIVAQVSLSLLLVTTALLFVRTFQNLAGLNVGFETRQILIADFDLSPLKLPVEQRLARKRALLAQVRAVPGVLSAAEVDNVPLSGSGWKDAVDVPGTAIHRKISVFTRVSADYFRTLEIPLIAGRSFSQDDTEYSPAVAVVNRTFARMFLGGGNPVGRTFGLEQSGGRPDLLYRVIGLVGDTKFANLREDFGPIVFVDQDQDPQPDLDATLLVRSDEATSALITALKSTAASIDPSIVLQFTAMRTSIMESLGRERLMASLSGFYGALAAMLATVGLYGMMSWMVVRRRSEIGVRMALGASQSGILMMMMREAMALLGIGLAVGVLLVMAAGRALQAMLYGLQPTDPSVMILAAACMAGVAMLASLLPAEGAAAVQPMETLREE